MESYFILDSQISASSEHSAGLGARNARLNLHAVPGIRHGSWSSGRLDFNQWLQVDFKKTVAVAKVATQGRMDANQWVTSYSLSYSTDGNNFQEYQQSGVVKVRINRSTFKQKQNDIHLIKQKGSVGVSQIMLYNTNSYLIGNPS